MKKRIGIAVMVAAVSLTACAPKAQEGTTAPASAESTESTESIESTDASQALGETAQPDSAGGGTQVSSQGQSTQEAAGQTEAAQSAAAKPEGKPSQGAKPGTAQTDAQVPDTTQPGTAQKVDVAADQTLTDIHDALKKAYGVQYIPSQLYGAEDLNEMFGVKKDWYDYALAEGPTYSTNVETFIGIKAKPGKAGDVKTALENYRTNALNGMQYPMNMPTVKASQVIQNGDYVFYVMLGSAPMDAQEQGDQAALDAAKKANQIGIDIINNYFKGK